MRAAIVLFGALAHAQSVGGRIAGHVVDPAGAAVPGARVLVHSLDTGLQRDAATDERGAYAVPELPVGTYSVSVDKEGLSAAPRGGVKVDIASEARIDFAMAVTRPDFTVSVEGEPALLQQDSGALSEVITGRQVANLPVNGRDFRRLTTLVPGAAPRSQRGSLGSFTVNGQREKSNIFLIDGVDNNDSFRNQPSFNQGGVTGAPATLFPMDALGEFSVQSQGAAEYGRNAGAILNIVVKSGTNKPHGSAYEFLRNDNLDARNFFEGRRNEFRNNNFGGVLGGPIRRDRAFFFGGYEGQREFVFSPAQVRVPTPAEIAAVGSPNALGLRLAALFPAPNLNVASGNNYSFAAPNVNNSDNFLAKVDHRVRPSLSLSGRYVFGDGSQTFPLTSGFGSPLPAYQTVVPTRVQLLGLGLTHILSARLVHETRAGWNRFVQRFTPLDADFDPTSIGLVTGSGLRSLPTITVAGFVSLGAPNNVPRGRVSSGYQFVDNLTWARGSHTAKAGFEYRRAIVNSFNDTNSRGRLNFASLADLVAGRVSSAGTALLRGATRRDTFTNNFGLFVQDDWKVSPRLAVNAGLRFDYLGVFREQHGRLANFLADQGLVRVDQLYAPDRNNFAPRLGFAYDVTGKSSTILRGAWGLYFDTPSQDFFLLQGFANGGAASPATNPLPGLGVFNVTFPAAATIPFAAGVAIFGAATSTVPTADLALFAVDPKLRTPYLQNYNLNLQHEVRPGTVLQVAYVGSRGTRLLRVRDINQAAPGPAATRQQRRPLNSRYPQYSFINHLEASANSNYNALQSYLKQRLSRGLSLYVAHTWSKSIDDASNGIYSGTRGVSFPQDSHNLRAERAVSSFDLRHRVTANFTYALPLRGNRLVEGWQLGGIYTGQSGLPITPFLSVDGSGTGELNDRPNLVGNPNNGPKRPSEWFARTAFARPADGAFGNSGRNVIVGPSLHAVDFSAMKSLQLTERLSLQLRAEAFNLFNRANLSLPNVDFNSAAFGSISETPDVSAGNPRLGEGGPRVAQLGLKLVF
jgi:hypothetical protein